MSEFSESYLLRSDHAEDAIVLLRRAKVKGFVYQPANGWVTFVSEGGSFEPDQRIIASTQQPLLHYASAEDHGWGFVLFNQARLLAATHVTGMTGSILTIRSIPVRHSQ